MRLESFASLIYCTRWLIASSQVEEIKAGSLKRTLVLAILALQVIGVLHVTVFSLALSGSVGSELTTGHLLFDGDLYW